MSEKYADKLLKSEEDGVQLVRTHGWSPPGDHPVGCSMYLKVKDGKVVGVEGDPEDPITNGRLCIRCLALPEYMYSPDRILTPLLRDPSERGKDTWKPISWDEAYDIAESKVRECWEKWGKNSIMLFQGTGREANIYAPALCNGVLQSANHGSALAGESCYGPRNAQTNYVLGAGYPELDYAQFCEKRYDDPEYTLPECAVIWGKDPLFSNPDGFFGHSLVDLMKRGTKFITIDPRLTWTAARAEYALQVRPGTDAAIGLAILNVIINEDLYDHDFVENWCYGFDELKERVQEYPPSKAAEICWVPEEDIIGAARMMATAKPCTFMWGLAMDQNTNGVQVCQCWLDVVAITGNLDIPGGVVLGNPGANRFLAKWLRANFAAVAKEDFENVLSDPRYNGFNKRKESHPDCMLDNLETGEPYKSHLGWFIETNPLPNTGVQTMRWYKAFLNLDFNIIMDIVMTPTAMGVCDLFLPVNTFAEHDGIVTPHFGRNCPFAGAINKAVEVGDTKSDLEIILELGRRLNPDIYPWKNAKEFLDFQMQDNYGVTWDQLNGELEGRAPLPNPYRKHEKGLLRADGWPGFATPTGMVELSSSIYPDWNEQAVPYFFEPAYSPYRTPELAEKYPLVYTTGARQIPYFHSECRHVPSLRKTCPDPLVSIHPDTAKKYGIEDGNWVCIENMFGQCIQKAKLTYGVHPNVIHLTHGWWFPEQEGEAPNLFGTFKANPGNIIPHHVVGKLGWGAPYKSGIARIYRVNSMDDFDPNYPEEPFLDINPKYCHDKVLLREKAKTEGKDPDFYIFDTSKASYEWDNRVIQKEA
jgi:anaerobic selenocysteine-containing dehydrogenase